MTTAFLWPAWSGQHASSLLVSWVSRPTFPQLFVDGELIGGCDIVTEMFEKGELQPIIDGAGGEAEATD